MSESFRVPLARYPGMNPFVLDWLRGGAAACELLPRGPMPRAPQHRPRAAAVAPALIESNRRWGIDVATAVDNWAAGAAVTIVAGQQVGFAGGPLYTLAKVATIVRMKRDLEAAGIAATALFWLATEDHDFDEIARLNLPVAMLDANREVNRQLDLVCMRAARTADLRAAVGPLPVPDSLTSALVSLLGVERPCWLRDGISLRDSFAELIAAVFGNEVVLVDALLPALRKAGAPLFGEIRRREPEIQAALQKRATALDAAGYREQVVPRDGETYTLLFELDAEGRRMPLVDGNDPERISTSAITRPLLQDFVLRPDVFVGGPAEVAYYAQIGALHEMLTIAMPRVALRGHLLVGANRVIRAIEKFGIDPARAFEPADALAAGMESEQVEKIRARAAAAQRDLLAGIGEIAGIALPAEHALARSFQRSVGHLEYHFGKLVERATRAVARKDRARWLALRALVAELHPDQHVQDRVVNWIPYWLAYGERLPERMIEEVEPDSDHFRIIGL